MKNQIKRISLQEESKIKSELRIEGYFVTEINATALTDDKTYLAEMKRAFEYNGNIENFNWLDDVMTDLYWLKNDKGYILFINNAQSIVYPYPENAPNNFSRVLFWMEFWEEEVENVVMGGKKKKFDVYLVY
ncbi:hypothetical protein SAMN02745116_01426 [Pilibacter termitis]|uniref:Barstar (barnase inhibitor) domain-containing protein n=1 Tax=Pilibacter termitis TaxID=263852 RepID=A0A1T4NHN4_9ENTE|nr:hypothetical protein [Pilibacter termitis]SJZ78831.1 hypothetical protein SAMN02745116_01426 [Pilibacter termitis]